MGWGLESMVQGFGFKILPGHEGGPNCVWLTDYSQVDTLGSWYTSVNLGAKPAHIRRLRSKTRTHLSTKEQNPYTSVNSEAKPVPIRRIRSKTRTHPSSWEQNPYTSVNLELVHIRQLRGGTAAPRLSTRRPKNDTSVTRTSNRFHAEDMYRLLRIYGYITFTRLCIYL